MKKKSQTYHDQMPCVFIVTKLMVIDCDKYLSLTQEGTTTTFKVSCIDKVFCVTRIVGKDVLYIIRNPSK